MKFRWPKRTFTRHQEVFGWNSIDQKGTFPRHQEVFGCIFTWPKKGPYPGIKKFLDEISFDWKGTLPSHKLFFGWIFIWPKTGLTLASRAFCCINFLSPEKGPYAGTRKFWIQIGWIGWMKLFQQKMASYSGNNPFFY